MTARKPPKTPRKRSSSTTKGRPTKCTPERIDTLAQLIASGSGREAAALESGIGVATWHEWIARGRAGEEPYAELVRRIEGASEGLHDKVRGVLLAALNGDDVHLAVKVAMFLAERLWPHLYGRRQEITGAKGGPVQVEARVESAIAPGDVATMTPEQIEAAMRGLAGRTG